MRKIALFIALAAMTSTFAQERNTNEAEVKTVKKTITTDSDGVKVDTKVTTTTAERELALTNFDGKHNFNTVMTPVKINSDVKYSYDGNYYRFTPSESGYYTFNRTNSDMKSAARIYPTSQNGYYIYTYNGNSSFGYFNADGDFVVESYDADGDGVMNYVYKIKMSDDAEKMKMKKNKM